MDLRNLIDKRTIMKMARKLKKSPEMKAAFQEMLEKDPDFLSQVDLDFVEVMEMLKPKENIK